MSIATGIIFESMQAENLPIKGLALVDEVAEMPGHTFVNHGGVIVRIHWAKTPKSEQQTRAAQLIAQADTE